MNLTHNVESREDNENTFFKPVLHRFYVNQHTGCSICRDVEHNQCFLSVHLLSPTVGLGIWKSRWMNAIRHNMIQTKCQHVGLQLSFIATLLSGWMGSSLNMDHWASLIKQRTTSVPLLHGLILVLVFCANHVYKVYRREALVTTSFNHPIWMDGSVLCPLKRSWSCELSYSCSVDLLYLNILISFKHFLCPTNNAKHNPFHTAT